MTQQCRRQSTVMGLWHCMDTVISRISKVSENISIYNFIITTFDCQGGGISARAYALVWRRHCSSVK